MTDEKVVRSISVTVRNDNIITARETSTEDSKQQELKGSVEVDDLKTETLRVLVNLLRENRLSNKEEYEVLGANLYSMLFDNEIGKRINKVLFGDDPLNYLRLELQFEDKQSELSSWPWEFLYCPKKAGQAGSGYFLAKKTKLVLTRRLELDIDREITVDKMPVKILFVAPSPNKPEQEGGDRLDPVMYDRVLEKIQDMADKDSGRISVFQLIEPASSDQPPKVTFEAFRNQVELLEPHLIHFVGHGRYVPGEGGQVAFVKSDSTPDWRTEDDFANAVGDDQSLRMVFLQACESALPDPYQALSGVAMRLAHNNIPVVVAMQYKVGQIVASLFASEFYGALASEKTIEVAVQEGRKKISDEIKDYQSFALPVLYLRRSESLLGAPKQASMGQIAGADSGSRPCPNCKAMNEPDKKFCGQCGEALLWCSRCGGTNKDGAKFCGSCGNALT